MKYIDQSATISADGKYRYILRRCWDNEKPSLAYIMLNPSTADGSQDDPTIRKCVGFAERLGYGSFSIVNLFAYRATDPKELKTIADPEGPGNNAIIKNVCSAADFVIAAWGVHGGLRKRDTEVIKLLDCVKIYCLGITKDGNPKHPLYTPYDTSPEVYITEVQGYSQQNAAGQERL